MVGAGEGDGEEAVTGSVGADEETEAGAREEIAGAGDWATAAAGAEEETKEGGDAEEEEEETTEAGTGAEGPEEEAAEGPLWFGGFTARAGAAVWGRGNPAGPPGTIPAGYGYPPGTRTPPSALLESKLRPRASSSKPAWRCCARVRAWRVCACVRERYVRVGVRASVCVCVSFCARECRVRYVHEDV